MQVLPAALTVTDDAKTATWRARAAVYCLVAVVLHGAAMPVALAQAPLPHTQGDTPPMAEPESPDAPAAPPPIPMQPSPGQPVPAQPRPVAPFADPAADLPAESGARASADGERDAESDTGAAAWLMAGCIVNVSAIIAAYVVDATPPYGRLIGRSPEYISFYVPAYRQTASEIRLRYAMIGCGGSIVLTFGFLVLTAIANQETQR